ncbi:MAG TPA: hypothetical protein VK797_29600 [Tepidisphaeraceae bacterium]|jgi:uncharacterized protein (TIGR02646 family)|nr:hypothetical protein [Tepidisphaeraceae bacterium]
MRYIDIDQLQLPNGWQARAHAAINSLRNEIQHAEAVARAAGEDANGIADARKSAITGGLEQTIRERVWRDLAPQLSALSKGKCWYSESRNPTADKNVDHFRPKNRVDEDPGHEGYWWLAFDWRNYRYSSQWCNQRRNDKIDNTNGGKWDHFPLCPGSFRARAEGDDYDQEEPELLDPIDPDDWKLLSFRPNGEPTPNAAPSTKEYSRAEKTIVVYHLHFRELVNERRPISGQVERLAQEMESLYPKIKDLAFRRTFKNREKDLLRLIHPDSDYSAAALAYARAQVYKLEKGHQVRREWLEDILNSHA